MGALPNPALADLQYALYIEELHQFFAGSGLYYGSPSDILALTERLHSSQSFADHLSTQLRTIALREGGAISRAQVLEIVAVAIGGSAMERAPQRYREPLRQLYAFVTTVLHRPGQQAEIVAFPGSGPRRASDAITRSEHEADRLITLPSNIPDRPLLASEPEAITQSFNKLLTVAVVALFLTLGAVLALRSPSNANPQSAVPQPVAAPATAHSTKPSPYGEAYVPRPKRRRTAPGPAAPLDASIAAPEPAAAVTPAPTTPVPAPAQ